MIPNLMSMGESGCINPQRVLMVVSLKSAPIKRLLKETPPYNVINMTYGYPQRSLIVFDNGMLAITRHEVETLSAAIRRGDLLDDAANEAEPIPMRRLLQYEDADANEDDAHDPDFPF
jgi:regulator of extracellular matrix RemA (YlzA/DUF370 family)